MYNKSYNRWFVTGKERSALRKWTIKKKKYRFKLRKLSDNILGLEDGALDSNAHGRKDIVRVVLMVATLQRLKANLR